MPTPTPTDITTPRTTERLKQVVEANPRSPNTVALEMTAWSNELERENVTLAKERDELKAGIAEFTSFNKNQNETIQTLTNRIRELEAEVDRLKIDAFNSKRNLSKYGHQ